MKTSFLTIGYLVFQRLSSRLVGVATSFSMFVLSQDGDQISGKREDEHRICTLHRENKMYRMLIVVPLTALLLTACVVAPGHRGSGVILAPALPLVVELGVEPYYYYGGYHYYYNRDRWSYSNTRSGPWVDLPRSHYPREVRIRGGGDGWGRDQRYDRRGRY